MSKDLKVSSHVGIWEKNILDRGNRSGKGSEGPTQSEEEGVRNRDRGNRQQMVLCLSGLIVRTFAFLLGEVEAIGGYEHKNDIYELGF